MENSPYILVAGGGGQQLQLPVAAASSASAASTLTKGNSGHAVVMSNAGNTHIANFTAGKSLLNVQPIRPDLAASWKLGDSSNRQVNTQTHPVRFIVTNSKDGFVSVPNFASLPSGAGTQGTVAANQDNAAAANNSRFTFIRHSSAGVMQKIAPAATNFLTPVPNGSSRTTIAGGNKMPGRTVSPIASFSNTAAALVPKTSGSAGAVWGPLSAANSTIGSNSVPAVSPSKQVIIQLAPEQLVCCPGSVCF